MNARRILLAGLAAAVLVPAAANAAVRYAVPSGGAPSGDCRASAPCTLVAALQGSSPADRPSDGDDVRLAAGEYTITDRLNVFYRLNISGPDGVYTNDTPWAFLLFSPSIPDSTPKLWFDTTAAGTRLERIAIHGTVTGTALVNLARAPGSTVDRVEIFADGTDGTGLAGDDLAVTNTLIQQNGTSTASAGAAITGTLTGSSITATTGVAINLYNANHFPPFCSLSVRNTIAVGAFRNARAEYTAPGGPSSTCPTVAMTVTNSWIPAVGSAGTGGGTQVVGAPNASLTMGTGNLADTPALTSFTAYAGTWLFPPTSPSVNAGCTAGCGTTDYRGRPRPIGNANDIGAGESSLPPAVGTAAATDVASTAATIGAAVNPSFAATSFTVQYKASGAASWIDGPTGDAGSGNSDQAASGRITGLAPATSYAVRVQATNSEGTTAGPEAAFRTAASRGTATPAALPAKWSRKGRTVKAIVTPSAGATSYRMSAVRTAGAAVTKRGRCVGIRVKKAKRQRCTITLAKGTWKVTVEGRKGPAIKAAASRTYTTK